MSEMYWVLQNDLFREAGFQRLVETLERLTVPFSIHKVIPFVGVLGPAFSREQDGSYTETGVEFDDTYEVELPEGPKIVMGSYSLARYATKHGWTPGSFANDNHDFQVQQKHWGAMMINGDALVLPFKDVPKTRELFFMRPVEDSKCFAGHVTGWGKYSTWRDAVLRLEDDGSTLTPETLVMISSVKEIYREYRLWVVDSRIVTASLYKEGSRVRYDERVDPSVIEYGRKVLDTWEPARAYCLDIFETEEGLQIGEVNNLNSAGFYAADLQKLVAAIEDMRF